MTTHTAVPIVLMLLATSALAGRPRIERISAFEDHLRLTLSPSDRPCTLAVLPPSLRGKAAPIAQLDRDTRGLTIPRSDGRRDRLYAAFQLLDRASGEPLGPPHYVDDLSSLSTWDNGIPWPKSIKGVTCPVDIADLQALGVKYVDTNVILSALVDWRDRDPAEHWAVDGQKIGINSAYVAALDSQIKQMTDAGINVTLIILDGVPTQPDPANPFIHPSTDLARAPNHLGAFNVTDDRGCLYLRAAMEYLAHRYSDPSGEHGRVSGYIIGNELQSHWYWHNQGEASLEEVVDDYAVALRIAWLAVRRYHSKVRVYCSLDHSWTAPVDPNPKRACRGDLFLERLNEVVRGGGDFPWNVAFHPYPENLFEPRFWLDKTAVMGFDTPRITFKNLEVLPAYLRQRRFLCRGRPRRIILSEQGFHCPDGPEGERIQAAAYAYAYYKTSHMPEIDAFILHRHVDHRAEAGLRLGLWSCKRDGPDAGAPDKKRLIWDTFRLADTDRWREAFAFALPIIGIDDWRQALPRSGRIPKVSGVLPKPIAPRSLVYDLRARMSEATGNRGRVWRADWQYVTPPEARTEGRPAPVAHANQKLYPTLFQHPYDPGEQPAEAVYTIALPQSAKGARLTLRFGTAVVAEGGDGVRFSIIVNGEEIWSADQPPSTSSFHSLDLSRYSGRVITLALRVAPLETASFDWAHWLRPVVVIEGDH